MMTEAARRIGSCILNNRANSTRRNKRKHENREVYRRLHQAHDATLDAQMSDVEEDYDNIHGENENVRNVCMVSIKCLQKLAHGSVLGVKSPCIRL